MSSLTSHPFRTTTARVVLAFGIAACGGPSPAATSPTATSPASPARATVASTAEPGAASAAKPWCGCAESDLQCRVRCAAGPSRADQAASPAPAGSCACAPNDLQCSLRCADAGHDPPSKAPPSTPAIDAALSAATSAARRCRRQGDPAAPAEISVELAPDGKARSAKVSPPYAGTATGRCIEEIFSQVAVPPFAGEGTTVRRYLDP